MTTTVYVLRAADDTVLYVGATVRLPGRLNRHQNERDWWPQVAKVDTDEYADHDEALICEANLIHELSPLHNVRHNTGERHLGRADYRRIIAADEARRAADPRTDDEILRDAFAGAFGSRSGRRAS